jgi:OmpA-OmpF porin, OOP family
VADPTDPPALPGPLPLRAWLATRPQVLAGAAFAVAALVALLLSLAAAQIVESRSARQVTSRLLEEGYTWAEVETDGLIVTLSGTAPNEGLRFSAMNAAGMVVESGRLRDAFEVTPAQAIGAPRFSVEMLRNDADVQLIGLLPEGEDKARLAEVSSRIMAGTTAADMLQSAAYPAPEGWQAALDLGMVALELLPQSKISVSAEGVVITAVAASEADKRRFEAEIARATPKGLAVTTNISAPRPVLTPFTLRFVVDAEGARFDACSADSEAARDTILRAASEAGAGGSLRCTVGLGVPSPSWARATAAAIRTLGRLGGGTVTFSDADITLLAGPEVSQATFDREIGELRAALPDVFALDAKMPEKSAAASAGPIEFTAELAAKTHRLDLRGRLTDDRTQAAVASFAKARFGAGEVHVATVLDPAAPDGWPLRVLAGLAALAELDHGTLLVRPYTVDVAGVSGSQQSSARISQLLSDKLGQGKTFKVSVRYDEELDPLAALPTPEECLAAMQRVVASRKISFAPGSAELDVASVKMMDALAKALKDCPALRLEIAGHTDAQGSEAGNQGLSQARAEAVLFALQGRRVDVSAMRAKGYGESVPIADNGSEEGREANRRIEFTLIDARPVVTAVPGTAPASEPAATSAPSVAPQEPTLRPKPRPKG